MGPEWAAMDKVLGHLSEQYMHIFIRRLPILLKNAIQFIENADEQYLLQTYRKSRIKYFDSYQLIIGHWYKRDYLDPKKSTICM